MVAPTPATAGQVIERHVRGRCAVQVAPAVGARESVAEVNRQSAISAYPARAFPAALRAIRPVFFCPRHTDNISQAAYGVKKIMHSSAIICVIARKQMLYERKIH